MNWTAIRSALQTAVVKVTGLPTPNVEWKGTPSTSVYVKGQVRCILSVKAIHESDWGEERRTTVSDNPLAPQQVNICGGRELAWSVRFESQGTDATSLAEQYASDFMTRIARRSTAMNYLLPNNLAVADVNIATGEFKSQNRNVQFAVVDVLLNAVENDIDTTPDYGGTINTVQFSSDVPNGPELQDVNGQPSAHQLSGEESV